MMSKQIHVSMFLTEDEFEIVKEEFNRVGDSIARLVDSQNKSTDDTLTYVSGKVDEHVFLCIKLRAPTIASYVIDAIPMLELKEKYRKSNK